MNAPEMIAQTSLYLAQDALSAARTRLRDADQEKALEEIQKTIESLAAARSALRGW